MTKLYMPTQAAQDLEPREISYGTCRALRIRQIGQVYLIENNQLLRDEHGKLLDNWKTIAVSRPSGEGKSPYAEAHEWLAQANQDVMDMIHKDRQTGKHANPGRARGG